jgi:TPR repeat protein
MNNIKYLASVSLLVFFLLPVAWGQTSDYESTRALAEQGNVSAQFNLALMYANGRGVAENDTEAVKWYRLASDQGHANAQSNLGYMYDNGRGVAQNDVMAYVWFSVSAAQGHENAKKKGYHFKRTHGRTTRQRSGDSNTLF